MRRESEKRKEARELAAPLREAFAWEYDQCFACWDAWRSNPAIPYRLETHEMARGCHRKEAYRDRATWLRLCRRCHDQMDDYTQWPVAKQLALKKICDPDYYERVKVNKLRGRSDNAITKGEVDGWIKRLQRDRKRGRGGEPMCFL